MRASPSFWWRQRPGPVALGLVPAAQLYGLVSKWRMNRPARSRVPLPVICVGNFVVGGAGKTPTALALAKTARSRGLKPGFLTRGYGGDDAGPLLVDPATHTPERVGDEALLLAAVSPTVVAHDRPSGAALLAASGIDLIIMDDGFQNASLAKDFCFVVVDADVGIGNGMVIPAGPLRVSLKAQLQMADALVVIGDGGAAEPLIRAAARAGRTVLHARLKPVRVKAWRKEPILAFAGIGRPQKFFDSLSAIEAPVATTMSFPDHHRYTEAEAERLIAHADAAGLRLVTTEKDIARLASADGAVGRLRDRSDAFAVALEFENLVAVAEMVADVARDAEIAGR